MCGCIGYFGFYSHPNITTVRYISKFSAFVNKGLSLVFVFLLVGVLYYCQQSDTTERSCRMTSTGKKKKWGIIALIALIVVSLFAI